MITHFIILVFHIVIDGFSYTIGIFIQKKQNQLAGMFLCGNVVCWKSAKQTIITYSIMKVELIALDAANSEAE